MSARRRRKPMARRVTESERLRHGDPVAPEEATPAFYDPEEAFAALDRPEGDPSTPEHAALFDMGALDAVDDVTALETDEDSAEAPQPAPAPRRRRSLLAAWLFGGTDRGKRQKPETDVVAAGTDEADGQLVITELEPVTPHEPSFEVMSEDAPGALLDDDMSSDGAETVLDPVPPVLEDMTVPEVEPAPTVAVEVVGEDPTPEPGAIAMDDAEGASAEPVTGELAGPAAEEPGEPEPADERRVRPVRRRRAGRAHRQRQEPVTAESIAEAGPLREPSPTLAKARSVAARGAKTLVAVVAIIAVLLGALYGLVVGVNAFARWNARRLAAGAGASTTAIANNLLVIGVRDGIAVGFTALKAERANNRVLGIAIPDGAFVEVPGQGFERIGSSYVTGPGVSKDTVSNYLGVPFRRYVVVDGDTYQALLANQNVAGLMDKVTATDLTSAERASFIGYFATVKTKDVWIVPLPVKPVAVGDQRYFEPQRAQVADLLLQWWGVKVSEQKSTPRVIVYNGVGTPGLAGLASQQLIRTGFRVVNSGNAQNFDYKQTLILLYHGTQADAEAVRAALGVGQVKVESAPQDLTDMIVIIGADYRPPIDDASSVPTEGAK